MVVVIQSIEYRGSQMTTWRGNHTSVMERGSTEFEANVVAPRYLRAVSTAHRNQQLHHGDQRCHDVMAGLVRGFGYGWRGWWIFGDGWKLILYPILWLFSVSGTFFPHQEPTPGGETSSSGWCSSTPIIGDDGGSPPGGTLSMQCWVHGVVWPNF